MARPLHEGLVAGVLLVALGAAFWLVRGGPGVEHLVQLGRDLLGVAIP